MKVLIINTHGTFNYDHHGQIRNAEKPFYLARYLAASGHEVTLIYASPIRNTGFSVRKSGHLSIIYLPALVDPAVYRSEKPSHAQLRIISRRLDLVLSAVLCAVKSSSRRYQVVHSFAPAWPGNYLPVFLTDMFRGDTRIVLDVGEPLGGQTGIANLVPPTSAFDRAERSLLTFLEKSSLRVADAAIVATTLVENMFLNQRFPRNRIFKIPIGVDLDMFKNHQKSYARERLRIPKTLSIITYVGGSVQLPVYFAFLLEVLKLVRTDRVRMMFVGARVPETVRTLVDKMGLNEKVIFTGPVSLSQYALYLSASDVQLLPMQDNPVDHWRWPNRLQEYMASGRPIVASPAGEAARIINQEHCGLVARSFDPEDFAAQVVFLLGSQDKAEEFGTNARKAAEDKYDWNKICCEIERIYLNIC